MAEPKHRWQIKVTGKKKKQKKTKQKSVPYTIKNIEDRFAYSSAGGRMGSKGKSQTSGNL